MPDAHPELLLAVVHIGPRRAQRLIDGLGADWAAVIDMDPERVFATLRGLGRRRARAAAGSWAALRGAPPAPSPDVVNRRASRPTALA